MGSSAPRHRVAYLVSEYPLTSHTFIEREINGLRRLGVEVHTFTARRTPAAGLLDERMRSEARATVWLADLRPRSMAVLLRTALADPAVTVSMVWRALRTGSRGATSRLKQLLYLGEAYRLVAEMRTLGLRQIHVHFANNGADIARLAVELGRRLEGPSSGWSWSFTMHGPTEFEAVERYDLAAKVESASRVACISDFTRSQLMRLVRPAEWPKLEVVRMSVDLAEIVPSTVIRGRRSLRILSVGRLVSEKGAPMLLDAVAELRRRGVGVDVRLVGGGPLEGELREQIRGLQLGDRVTLTGPLSQADVRNAYRAWADAFCLPSFQEGLPVVLMEAMAHGLPVVTTTIAGIPELVTDRVTGRLVAPGRVDLLADALEELGTDPELGRRWGAAGPDRVAALHDQELTSRAQRAFLFPHDNDLRSPQETRKTVQVADSRAIRSRLAVESGNSHEGTT